MNFAHMSILTAAIGGSFAEEITITDVNGDAVNLTGATVTMTIYDRNGDTLHSEVVTTHTTPASGVTTIAITKEETAVMPMGCYPFNVFALLASGENWICQSGFFEVA